MSTATRNNHEIDYKIYGEELQFVEIELDPSETAIAESGAMMMMDDGVQMQTIFGDGSAQQPTGLLGKLMSAGKRVLTGESLFMTAFTNEGQGKKKISFAAPYTGKIILWICGSSVERSLHKRCVSLCCQRCQCGIPFQRKLGVGIFGGEGFIMEKIEGDGMAFMHAGGFIIEKELKAGEILKVDTGCLVAYMPTISFEIEMVRGIKNVMFGGEGLFLPNCRGREKSGYNLCRLAGWRDV
ncbi:MAG: AIM24 family protein [Chitinophagaceae bacterium]|nr:AIM24 family protein [Chitinophagaceae bacterium]